MAELKAATFDCYGTLVDWEAGLGTFLYDVARRAGERDPPPGRELRERWEQIQFELIQGEYRSYRDILVDSLRTWVGERGYRWNEQEGEALERAMQSWQPFPDIAFGFQYDIGPAQRKGMATAWVNRDRRPIPGAEVPDHEWDSLWGLAEMTG